MIEFRVDDRSGVPAYLQLVRQVEHAVRLGLLRSGDRLPTVKEVAASLAVNPNTVGKAYRELEHRGLTEGRVGQGTYVVSAARVMPAVQQSTVQRRLRQWVRIAVDAGFGDEDIEAMLADALRAGARAGGPARAEGARAEGAGRVDGAARAEGVA